MMQIQQIMEIYGEIDRQIEVFQTASGLQCPSGCGKCCQNPEVETTPLQMLPLAMALINQDLAEAWLEKVDMVNYAGACVFYQSDRFIAGNGRCGVYAWRPSLCRLFGFAATRNKHGEPELAACKVHKETMPELVATVPTQLAPSFADFAMQLANLDPSQSELMPINKALAIAIQKLGLAIDYQKSSETFI